MRLKSFKVTPADMRHHQLIIATFLTVFSFSAGCQNIRKGSHTSGNTVTARAITRLPVQLVESSGIAVSGSNRIWSHEDSGNKNELYCFDTTGALLRTLLISNAVNIDWEDIAAGDDNSLYIGDFGNNNNSRKDLTIYIIPDPETITGDVAEAGTIHFTLSDQTAFPPPATSRNYDIEAMAWHADSLYLFTKDRSKPFTGITKMYALPASPGTYTARLAGSQFIGNTVESGRITAADINQNTGELVLLTNQKIVSFRDYPENRFFEGTKTEYFFATPPGQNEALAFTGNRKLYMTEEGKGDTPGFLYEIILPAPLSVGKLPETRQGLSVYPNPARDLIRLSEMPLEPVHIYNLEGKEVFTAALPANEVNLSQLVPGAYILSARLKEEISRCLFLKQ